jgi:PST family polysaccharide transporter
MAAANVVRLGAQVAILPIIARLLGPESYGIVALATPFVFFLLLFGDAGLAATLVRAKTATRELESTIFWVAVSIGLSLALLLAAAAYPLGHVLGQPEVSPILIGFCPVFVLATLGVVPSARLQRTGRFGIFALSDIISSFAGMGIAVYCALSGWGAWSLVAQQLTVWICKVCVVTAAARFLPLFVFHFAQVRSALKFGSGLLGSQIAGSLDNVLVGTFLGTAPLGSTLSAIRSSTCPAWCWVRRIIRCFPPSRKRTAMTARWRASTWRPSASCC